MNKLKRNKRLFKPTVKQRHPKTLRNLALAFAIVIISGFLYLRFLQPHTLDAKQRVQLESTTHQLQETKQQLQQQKSSDAKAQAEQQKKLDEVNQKLQETEKALQAKRSIPTSQKTYAAELPAIPAYTPSGDKNSWLAQSGIPEDLWGYVDWIVTRESGWKPCAYNPGKNDCSAYPTSACGLVQQYPCHKIDADWRDPVAALKWQYNYVNSRYGGYAQAVAYWQIHGNY